MMIINDNIVGGGRVVQKTSPQGDFTYDYDDDDGDDDDDIDDDDNDDDDDNNEEDGRDNDDNNDDVKDDDDDNVVGWRQGAVQKTSPQGVPGRLPRPTSMITFF